MDATTGGDESGDIQAIANAVDAVLGAANGKPVTRRVRMLRR